MQYVYSLSLCYSLDGIVAVILAKIWNRVAAALLVCGSSSHLHFLFDMMGHKICRDTF